MSALSAEALERHRTEQQRHFVRNYLAHGLEGGFFVGGLAFVAPSLVLPTMIHALGGPTWMIAFSPIIYQVGYFAPQIFMAGRIERLKSMRPFVLCTGVPQRVSYLVAGLVLMGLADRWPGVALAAVVLAPLISSLSGGVSSTAWQEFVAKTIPGHRRASLWGLRNVISALIGLGAGYVVRDTLVRHPGPTGYGILHLWAFGLMSLSYIIFATSRETPLPPKRAEGERVGWFAYLRGLPAIVRADGRLSNLLISRFLATGWLMLIPFLGIHALGVLKRPDSFLGMLLMAQMTGGIFGNLIGGFLGDRFGGKSVVLSGRLVTIVLCVGIIVGWASWHFIVLFGLFGMAQSLENAGQSTLGMEISPVQRRVAYMTIIGLVNVSASLTAALAGTFIRSHSVHIVALALPSAFLMLISFVFLARIAEPRHSPPVD